MKQSLEGYPELIEKVDENGIYWFGERTQTGEGWWRTAEERDEAVERWLRLKYEAENPRTLADQLADALRERFDALETGK